MASPYTAFGGGPDASGSDRGTAWAVTATTTLYQLFSFLFGYSFGGLQDSRAVAADVVSGGRQGCSASGSCTRCCSTAATS
ncbi:hypothetical protein [Streptomyces griseorubiginosus]